MVPIHNKGDSKTPKGTSNAKGKILMQLPPSLGWEHDVAMREDLKAIGNATEAAKKKAYEGLPML